ncbi:ECF-type riboflavin transporter substrate-binding protein [Atopobacter sp. AH10]|uniref:ECF-type riboflavin transporter substrate-binding protein n=1 Tax=Atopobacter sp. AH10 TaxID=2315861 RepID=UPI000EF1A8DA|nr:ECF-type riboflavin transporter substrate-binding protein [Atopobacter sp. AH10]RLK62813.1 ECF-type riboflavin transporter substrate-binding protein [Atopobacter sp. AH10]
MKKNQLSIRTIVAIGIGAAVFVILSRFADIPTPIPNTSIKTSYPFLAVMASLFGPTAGMLIGFIGHALTDFTSYGSVWWSWVVVSGVVGLGIGLLTKNIGSLSGSLSKKQILQFNLAQILTQAIGFGLVAPILDILIYAEPAKKVFTQGFVAGLANIITVAVIGTAILAAYAKTQTKANSLTKE